MLKQRIIRTYNIMINSDGEEVALVYLRTGYHPRFFTCENVISFLHLQFLKNPNIVQVHTFLFHQDWEALLLIERSKAIKCPPVHYHLAGCKKIQQVLCEPGVLEKFINNPETLIRIRETFAKIYSLEMVFNFFHLISHIIVSDQSNFTLNVSCRMKKATKLLSQPLVSLKSMC